MAEANKEDLSKDICKHIEKFPHHNWVFKDWGKRAVCYFLFVCNNLFSSKPSKHTYTQTVRVRELKFWENVHPPLRFRCQMSGVRCQVSLFSSSVFVIDTMVELDVFRTECLMTCGEVYCQVTASISIKPSKILRREVVKIKIV